jgi:hypothetical protein
MGKTRKTMWQPLRNFVDSLATYGVLSPDMDERWRVNQWLRSRPCLSAQEWFIRYWSPPAVAESFPQPLVNFTYHQLHHYSGLDIGCVQPSDRLVEDLKFPAVCWFDWGLALCDDFYTTFGLDITDDFDETQLDTCADLVHFLKGKLEQSR